MVEVALVLPILVTIIIAGIDLSRYVAMHSAADSASREATRYASAVGPGGESPPRYVNGAGIRAAAVEAAPVLDLSASTAVLITFEDGDGDALPAPGVTCPSTPPPADVHRLDKIVVTVTTRFEPTIALLKPIDIVSVDRRSIVKEP
jgi:Flp pilus assembly protein TadG